MAKMVQLLDGTKALDLFDFELLFQKKYEKKL
jgi:hypothetical protein